MCEKVFVQLDFVQCVKSFLKIFRNGTNFLFKLFAWIYTGSHSMFSECIHSLADTINQLILAYGIHKSVQVSILIEYAK